MTILLYALLLYFLVGSFLYHIYKIAIIGYYGGTISKLGWFLWPDVDVKFRIGKEFVAKYTNDKFYRYLILFGPFRLLHIFAIHLGHILGLILISLVVLFLLIRDFFEKVCCSHNSSQG